MLGRHGQVRGLHAAQECGALVRHDRRRVPELAVVLADRRVGRRSGRRHRVHHGSEVDVHAGAADLAAPRPCVGGQGGVAPGALGERGRHPREPRPLQDLDVPSLLIRRHEQWDRGGGGPGREGVHAAGHGADGIRPAVVRPVRIRLPTW